MIYDIIVKKIDDVNMSVQCEDGVAFDLQDFFSYKADGYRFHPKYKARIWDGSIKLFGAYRRVLYIGLLHKLISFCRIYNYSIDIDKSISEKTDVTPKSIVEFVDSLNLTAHNKKITPRDYQYYAIYHAIYHKRSTIVAPTACLSEDTLIEVEISDEAYEYIS